MLLCVTLQCSQGHPLGAEQWEDVLPVIGVQQSDRQTITGCMG
jgi:hypothetical protein